MPRVVWDCRECSFYDLKEDSCKIGKFTRYLKKGMWEGCPDFTPKPADGRAPPTLRPQRPRRMRPSR